MDIFQSKRLLYRAPEDSDADKAFFHKHIVNDPIVQTMSNPRLHRPLPSKSAEDTIKFIQDALLGVCIYVAPQASGDENSTPAGDGQASEKLKEPKGTPIGHVSLFNFLGPSASHHRKAMLGISLAEEYRGQGYGREAIDWALDWAFQHAGLHRVYLHAMAYNEPALKLYRKMGFVEEGREREALLYRRAWHDVINFSMLEHEWEQLRETQKAGKE
ncbi:uncharacterized protein N7459_003608 [Penicillium hispanicum]|uniref:uncharacterized protein n=1 Tax=Penicillium hispanicum TaxID=1080232 RepID=UPI00254166EC|nr:uncharacterized protein N7459_003608 [Penicillium hispanicum]KAJ5587843.1 hypothetical protein N7459_003608 [Penicillium hispanicum]